MKKYIIGVDVGGTNIKFGIVSHTGQIITRGHLDTKKFLRKKTELIAAIITEIFQIIQNSNLKKQDIVGVGMGLPGLINPLKGMVDSLPNIPGWKNVPLAKIISRKTGFRTVIENDVNLITLGEWKFGAGKGYDNLACITLGTGVGGGLILNGALYRGEGYVAGEIGHMPLNEVGPVCPCGGFGCFERYAGNEKLLADAQRIFGWKIKLPEIYPLAARGDPRALKFWENVGVHIGNGLVGIVNLLNPKLIIIGGGVSNNYRFMGHTIKGVIKNRAMKVQGGMVKITKAQLGDDAGIIGAKVLLC